MRFTIPMLAVAMTATPLMAKDVCHTPKNDWRSADELKTELTGKGWQIKTIKTEDGCYEVYAHDQQGKRVEALFDPKTFEAMGSDD